MWMWKKLEKVREEGEKYDFCGNVNRETVQTKKKDLYWKEAFAPCGLSDVAFVTVDTFYLKYDLII